MALSKTGRFLSKAEILGVFSPLSIKHWQTACRCVKKNARVENNAFKHSYTVECGNRLRVGVRAKNASVSGFACRPF